jgi:hypothetical protein
MQMVSQKIREEIDKNQGTVNEGIMQMMRTYLANRWRISIKSADIFWYSIMRLLCCCCIGRFGTRHGRLSQSEKKINLYRRGEEKVKQELDCINLMTRLRQLDLLVSLFLSSQQKVLLHFSKKNLIRCENDRFNSSSEEEFGNNQAYQSIIPKYPEDTGSGQMDPQFERQLENADEVMSEAMRALFLNKQELSTVNKKILFGILSKKPEKHLMKLAYINASMAVNGPDGQQRTGNGLPGLGATKTPIFYDLSQSSLQAPDYVVEETGQLSV